MATAINKCLLLKFKIMKRLKVLIPLLIIMFISSGFISAQDEYRIQFDDDSESKKLVITNIMGSLKIKAHRSNDIVIKFDKKKIKEEIKKRPDRAKGLKPLGQVFSDETDFGFSISEDENTISIIGSPFELFNGLLDDEEEVNIPDYEILVPEKVKIVVNGGQFIFHPDNDRNKLIIENIKSEIVVNAFGGGVLIKNISGPATIHSLSGTTTVIFSEVNQDSPISITASTGDVDVTIPGRTTANVNFNAIMGEVYTDFEIEVKGGKKKPKYDIPLISTENIGFHGKINGGGVSMNITAITGNIYLRKK